jgi:class 3 adenylate cyclase
VSVTLRHRWRWLVVRVLTPVFYGCAATLLVAFLQSASTETGLSRLERDAYAWHLLHRPSRAPDPRIALVAADDADYEVDEAQVVPPVGGKGKDLSGYRPADCDCPIYRGCYARAIRRLKAWNARVIVLDVMLRRRGHPAPLGVTAEDDQLRAAILDAQNVIVAASSDPRPLGRSADPRSSQDMLLADPTAAIQHSVLEVGSPRIDPQNQEYAFELVQTARGRHPGEPGKFYYALPYVAWSAYQDPMLPALGDTRRWQDRMVEGAEPRLLGDFASRAAVPPARAAAADVELRVIKGPVIQDEAFFPKRLLINYSSGTREQVGRYRPVRLSWLLEMPDAEGRRQFSDKLVIIGQPSVDLHRTAVGVMPGMEVLANAVATLLQDRPLVPVSNTTVLLLMLGLATVAAALMRALPVAAGWTVVGIGLVGVQYLSHRLLATTSLWLPPMSLCAAMLASASAAGAWESRRVQGLVSRLLPSRIARVMERAGGFQVEEGTVLFSDIRGYTAFSEHLPPAVVMTHLNHYFSNVQKTLDRFGGHFVKSPGDCVVAWFAEEEYGAHHSERAIRAGLALLACAEDVRQEWESAGLKPFFVGVGINTGPMAVGVLDACKHIEPTLIGDSVNLAARIEALTHEGGDSLLVSEETLAPVREAFVSEALGPVIVYGRTQPVYLHRIHAPRVPSLSAKRRGRFAAGPPPPVD